MTGSLPEDSPPRLEVTRIGGGPSARLGAVGVAAALAAIVLVGLASRGQDEPLAAGPFSGPRSSADASADHAAPAHYAVRATIGNSSYIAALAELRPNQLSATLRIPIPLSARSGTLAVSALSGAEPLAEAVIVGEWFLPLEALRSTSGEPQGVFISYVSARPMRDELAARFRDSFSIQVFAENDLLFGKLSVELTLGDTAQITTS